MTYNPTKVFQKDPISEEVVLQPAKVQLNLELIAQETKRIQTNINSISDVAEKVTSKLKQNTSNFTHDFLFL